MKQIKKIGLLLLLMSTITSELFCDCNATAVTLIPRSQGRDKTRQLIGTVGHTHLYDQESYYGMFAANFEYSHTFRPGQITQMLFGNDLTGCDCNNILIQGSQIINRDPKAWLADYFYLSPNFTSALSFTPNIQNYLLDLDLYIGLDPVLCGMYFRIYGPIAHTRWNLNFCERLTGTDGGSYPEGYFTVNELPSSQLLTNFTSYASGNAPGNGSITQQATRNESLQDFVTTFNKLQFSKITNCVRTRTGFADLRLELGWDFWNTECYHVGANIQGAIPTGNQPQPEFFFDPIIGNGHHWELGLGLTAHYMLFDTEVNQLGVYLDANVTHLFTDKQCRTFDLCNKPNSRYMLATRLGTPIDNLGGLVNSSPTPAIAQFKQEFTPIANLTTLPVNVSVNIQTDIVAMINYSRCNWSFDLGYNFWYLGCENIEPIPFCQKQCNEVDFSLCNPDEIRTWALKGDARVYGFLGTGDPIALSASEQFADIHNGTNVLVTNNAATQFGDFPYNNNQGVDNAAQAVILSGPALFISRNTSNLIYTSIQPNFLSCDDINFEQANRGISHKLFTHVNYTWDRDCLQPFFGIGAFVEFGRKKSCGIDDCARRCSDCVDTALSQWGVWIRGGLSFN